MDIAITTDDVLHSVATYLLDETLVELEGTSAAIHAGMVRLHARVYERAFNCVWQDKLEQLRDIFAAGSSSWYAKFKRSIAYARRTTLGLSELLDTQGWGFRFKAGTPGANDDIYHEDLSAVVAQRARRLRVPRLDEDEDADELYEPLRRAEYKAIRFMKRQFREDGTVVELPTQNADGFDTDGFNIGQVRPDALAGSIRTNPTPPARILFSCGCTRLAQLGFSKACIGAAVRSADDEV